MKIKYNRGITLVEVCLVGVILSIILATSWPVLNRFAYRKQLEQACTQVTNTYRYARDKALSENRHYRIKFDDDFKKYEMEFEEDPVNNPGNFVSFKDNLAPSRKLPENVFIKELSNSMIVVQPDGTSNDIAISFQGLRGDICKLMLNGSTGRVTLENVSQ